MNATSLPFSAPKPSTVRQFNVDGESFEEDLPPELFDPEEDLDELATYAHIADTWND
ncbi:hypothetical protein AEAC466_07190 [Asticcacaulis sp. AC466]|uniref:hypothetical protein n=1 Tax=Asticcacaulis sp. AC466 TaxID=1282362 RepID=UPI0003C3FF20|nr:hypothetical protein [Asticcacaulis sp. AC466]ESQ84835.1 hypothetical protein AEAC466_07190 [Asticcacaulis sp. AC466]